MDWRGKIARFFGSSRGGKRPESVKRWPSDGIDPIEELARIINEAQDRDAKDERRFDDLAQNDEPKPADRHLTTYEQPWFAMVQRLVRMVVGHEEPVSVNLPGRLIVRTST
jgi:hypothetical protein